MKERRPHSNYCPLRTRTLTAALKKRVREKGYRSRLSAGIFYFAVTRKKESASYKRVQGGRKKLLIFSDIETEEYDITILHDVILSFQTELSRFPYMGFRAIGNQIIDTIDFSLYESFLEIRVDDTSALRCFGTFTECPGSVFIRTCSEECPETKR